MRYSVDIFCNSNIKLLGLIECKECGGCKIISMLPEVDERVDPFSDTTDINISFIPEEDKYIADNYVCDKCKNK